MSGRLPRLLSPLRVGRQVLRNRVVWCAHLTNTAVDGRPTRQHAAYYGARAAGGAGLVVTEEHSVTPDDRPYEKLLRGHDPAVVPAYRELTAAVHAHGVPVLAQLNHNGGQSSSRHSRRPVLAPSPVPDPLFREVPVAAGPAQLAALVAAYAVTAEHCAAGGFDGVELQASQASVLRGFLSPATNRRGDAYGGPLPRRARLLLEVVAAVRAALGPDPVLGVRLSGDDGVEDGTTLDDAVETARLLEATGAVDYLGTAIGTATASLHLVEGSMAVPAGHALHVPRALRAAVALPVVGVGRITEPAEAERALAAGDCDLVGVVRGQIADPGWARAAATGRPVRRCLGCNQECIGRVGLNQPIACTVNPRAGREAVAVPAPRRPGRSVVVVGGGPGGLQAAVTAADRGHRVLLLERAARLGGQLAAAAAAPDRAGLAALVEDLAAACRRSGVTVRTGTRAGARDVLAERPDAVVLATGARPSPPPWAGGDPRVVDVRDVLERRVAVRGTVLVVDELGSHHATSTARLLAEQGCAVTVVTPGLVVGQDLGLTLDAEHWGAAAARLGIGRVTERLVTAVAARPDGRRAVSLLAHPTGATEERLVDWVVCARHPEPEEELWWALRDGPVPVRRVGDCLTPRRADAAVREGEAAAVAL